MKNIKWILLVMVALLIPATASAGFKLSNGSKLPNGTYTFRINGTMCIGMTPIGDKICETSIKDETSYHTFVVNGDSIKVTTKWNPKEYNFEPKYKMYAGRTTMSVFTITSIIWAKEGRGSITEFFEANGESHAWMSYVLTYKKH